MKMIPVDKGVPALAVLDRHGKLQFLNRWKPAKTV